MLRLLGLGVLSALFFSSTFVLNRAMSLAGGHWVWTASLRYGYMTLFLGLWLVITGKAHLLRDVATIFRRHWRFWIMAGSIGFGLFYATITFSALRCAHFSMPATLSLTHQSAS